MAVPVLAQCGSTSMAERFNDMAASEESQPEKVVQSLQIQPGMTVVDLGAGGGYFSYLMAKETGPEGTVLAVDIDADYLSYIEQEAQRKGLTQIKTVQARTDGFDARPESIDLIFSRSVYHHLENRVQYFKGLAPLLKPGARIAILDYRTDGNFADIIGHSTDPEIILEEMQQAGYERVENLEFLEEHSFQVFRLKTQRNP